MKMDKDDWSFWGFIVFFCAIIGFFVFVMIMATKEGIDETRLNNKIIGKRIVIGRDTLIITNHYEWGDNFMLSNGVKVDGHYCRKNYLK